MKINPLGLIARWLRGIKAAPGDRKYAERMAGPEHLDKSAEEHSRIGTDRRTKWWEPAEKLGIDPTKDPRDPGAGAKP